MLLCHPITLEHIKDSFYGTHSQSCQFVVVVVGSLKLSAQSFGLSFGSSTAFTKFNFGRSLFIGNDAYFYSFDEHTHTSVN